jgi:iron complex transport system substrate-binding protein
MVARLLGCLLALASCKVDGEPATGPIRVVDDLGHDVALLRPARRIASLSPSNTEILFALGCGEHIVLRDSVSTYPPRARRLPATSPFSLSPEHVAGFTPDLVLLSHVDAARLRALTQVGLVAASFDPRTVEQLQANIRAIGTLCGAATGAERLAARIGQQVARISTAVRGRPPPLVYIETDGSDPLKPWTAGPGSFVDQLLRLAGGRNLAASLGRPYAQISAEEVLGGRPDVVLLMSVEAARTGQGAVRLRSRPGWSALEAVRRGRIVDGIDADLISRPGPRLTDGLDALARALHPEAFVR